MCLHISIYIVRLNWCVFLLCIYCKRPIYITNIHQASNTFAHTSNTLLLYYDIPSVLVIHSSDILGNIYIRAIIYYQGTKAIYIEEYIRPFEIILKRILKFIYGNLYKQEKRNKERKSYSDVRTPREEFCTIESNTLAGFCNTNYIAVQDSGK